MKRFHVHIAVEKLDDSIRFIVLFGVAPTVVQPDYAKWMLEDPRVNFAILRGEASPASITWAAGESDAELAMRGQLAAADMPGRTNRGCLLCPLGQVLGDGPAGRGLGDLSYPRYDTDVWRGHTHSLPCRVRAVSRCRNLRARVSRPRVAFP